MSALAAQKPPARNCPERPRLEEPAEDCHDLQGGWKLTHAEQFHCQRLGVARAVYAYNVTSLNSMFLHVWQLLELCL